MKDLQTSLVKTRKATAWMESRISKLGLATASGDLTRKGRGPHGGRGMKKQTKDKRKERKKEKGKKKGKKKNKERNLPTSGA